jgi:hypothetical protein
MHSNQKCSSCPNSDKRKHKKLCKNYQKFNQSLLDLKKKEEQKAPKSTKITIEPLEKKNTINKMKLMLMNVNNSSDEDLMLSEEEIENEFDNNNEE